MERRFLLVYLALFAPYSVVTPFLQQLLHLYGYQHEQIGYLLGAIELMAVVAPPVWGLLSDRLHAPRAILLTTVLLSIPSLYLLRPGMSTSMGLLIILAFGFCFKPGIPLTDGLTFSHFRLCGADYGHCRIGGTICFVTLLVVFESVFHISHDTTGRVILAVLSGTFLCQSLSLLAVPPLPKQTSSTKQTASFPWKTLARPAFLLFVLAAFLGRFAMMSYYSFFSRYLEEVCHYHSLSYIWLLGSLCEFPVIFWSKFLIAKIGVKWLFVAALVGTVLRLAGFALSNSLVIVILLQPLHALTFGAFHIATVTYIGELFPASNQGSAQTIYSAVTVGLGGLLGSAICGIILQRHGYTPMYLTSATIAAIGLALALGLAIHRGKGTQRPQV
ncbi:MAG: MFS transporter [Victivallales bacterium]|nr:MFS transporter [Victivallales bacterium]